MAKLLVPLSGRQFATVKHEYPENPKDPAQQKYDLGKRLA